MLMEEFQRIELIFFYSFFFSFSILSIVEAIFIFITSNALYKILNEISIKLLTINDNQYIIAIVNEKTFKYKRR